MKLSWFQLPMPTWKIMLLLTSMQISYCWILWVDIQAVKQSIIQLSMEITSAETRIKEVTEIKNIRDDLLVYLKLGQDLNQSQMRVMQDLNFIANLDPSIMLLSLHRSDGTLKMDGKFEDSDSLSNFLKILADSNYVGPEEESLLRTVDGNQFEIRARHNDNKSD